MTMTPSAIVGRVLFWLIMILVIMATSEIIGLTAVADAIGRILGYIPSVISAALVLAAGVFLARFVGNVVTSGATAANLSYAKGLGAVANTSIVVMVGVVTLEQLGVDTRILTTVITVTVAAITAAMGLAFALGARDVVRSILAGHYLRQSLPEGVEVEAAGERGVVEQIGPVNTLFRDGERTWSVPNSRLLEEVVCDLPAAGSPGSLREASWVRSTKRGGSRCSRNSKTSRCGATSSTWPSASSSEPRSGRSSARW
jgi:hypothetical protein